ncbi:MAG: DsbA family protein [Bauldia sp.]
MAAVAAFFLGRQVGVEQTTARLAALPPGPTVIGAPTSPPDLMAAIAAQAGAPLPAAAGAGASRLAITRFDQRQQAEIGEILRQYLVANPEILRDAATALDAKQAAEEAAAQQVAVRQNHDAIFNAPNQIVLGNPEGDVTLVEFFDYNCTYCRKTAPDIAELIKSDPKLKIVLKEFPILGPGSVDAAKVSLALAGLARDKYGDFHNRLLTDQAQAGGDRALAVAEDIGLDPEALKALAAEPKVTDEINAVYTLATNLGLTGTPTFVIGDQVVVGAIGHQALQSKIQAVRTCGSPDCAVASTR